jgi:hypothetical protein
MDMMGGPVWEHRSIAMFAFLLRNIASASLIMYSKA